MMRFEKTALVTLQAAALVAVCKLLAWNPNAKEDMNVRVGDINYSRQLTVQPNQANDCLQSIARIRDIKLYSQNDEDGALLQTLICMGHGNKEYFEFGSENGMEVNTRVLRELYGWHGHLLDGGNENPDINLHMEWFTPSNIVSLLQKYSVSEKLDVLSIDADYDDFYIMREILLSGYRPRIMMTEYNSNFSHEWSITSAAKPIGKEAEVRYNHKCYYGASASAFIKLASAFGYAPVWANTVNLIFVNTELTSKMGMILPSPESIPGPWSRAFHHDCNGMTWKVVDQDTLLKATDKTLSHVDFVNELSDIKLGTMNFGNTHVLHGGWRQFYEIAEE